MNFPPRMTNNACLLFLRFEAAYILTLSYVSENRCAPSLYDFLVVYSNNSSMGMFIKRGAHIVWLVRTISEEYNFALFLAGI